jgi:hemolysin III
VSDAAQPSGDGPDDGAAPGTGSTARERAEAAYDSARERAEAAYDSLADRVETRVQDALDRLPDGVKPRLRGWLHLGAVPVSAALCLVLLVVAPTTAARASLAVYLATSVLLFAVSAVYHRGSWTPRMGGLLRRLDHANIFLIIAGTYTPFAVLLLPPAQARVLLVVVWVGAVAGVLFRMFWLDAPRWAYVASYVALGWVAAFFVVDIVRLGGALILALLVLGGLLYTAGAVVYATRKPDPSPRWFGYHEVFHACTIAAWLAMYAAVAVLVARA